MRERTANHLRVQPKASLVALNNPHRILSDQAKIDLKAVRVGLCG
jgi:hypothetical protein